MDLHAPHHTYGGPDGLKRLVDACHARRLIRLRREVPVLSDGHWEQVRVRFDEHAQWLAVDHVPVTVACNLAGRAQHVPISSAFSGSLLLASDPGIKVASSGVELPPDSVAVLGVIGMY